jgi:hypothetical protein
MHKVMRKTIIALVLSFSIGCSALPLKQTLVTSVQIIETSAGALQDTENAAYKAQLWKISPEAHREINKRLSRIFAAQIKLAEVLKVWKASDPYPLELSEIVAATTEIIDLISKYGYADDPQSQVILTMLKAILKNVTTFTAILGGAK